MNEIAELDAQWDSSSNEPNKMRFKEGRDKREKAA